MYPAAPGFHRLTFDSGKVVLTLLLGDAEELLPELDTKVDAWYLDGFAPSRNTSMWTESIFAQMARLSKDSETTVSTYSCARVVSDGSERTGFCCGKIKGFWIQARNAQSQV